MNIKSNQQWIVYFLRMAKLAASKSKDTTKVGCVLVSRDSHRVLSTGFNGFPRRIEDDPNIVPHRYERKEKLFFTAHAEMNAIASAAASGVRIQDAIAFVSLQPCLECAKALIQAGVSEVYYLREPIGKKPPVNVGENDWRNLLKKAVDLFEEAGVPLHECELYGDVNVPANSDVVVSIDSF